MPPRRTSANTTTMPDRRFRLRRGGPAGAAGCLQLIGATGASVYGMAFFESIPQPRNQRVPQDPHVLNATPTPAAGDDTKRLPRDSPARTPAAGRRHVVLTTSPPPVSYW